MLTSVRYNWPQRGLHTRLPSTYSSPLPTAAYVPRDMHYLLFEPYVSNPRDTRVDQRCRTCLGVYELLEADHMHCHTSDNPCETIRSPMDAVMLMHSHFRLMTVKADGGSRFGQYDPRSIHVCSAAAAGQDLSFLPVRVPEHAFQVQPS